MAQSVTVVGAIALLVLLSLLSLFAAWGWWFRERSRMLSSGAGQPSPAADHTVTDDDPRLTFATPYRNIRPEVKYVGDDACSACHPRLFNSYRNHPMGRSLSPIATAVALERYDAGAHNPFDAAGFRYGVERRGDRVLHQEIARDSSGKTVFEREAEVHFVLGSGERGRSYLINRDGYLFASPISWYPQKRIWDLSPGYAQNNPHFGRPIGPDCLFCHANRVEHIPDTANRYRLPLFREAAIGCERCHGPGELHVRRQQSNEEITGVDDTIVNPRDLEHGLREAVCQQCHLQGEQRVLRRGRSYFDYRPGLPLRLFFADFIRPAEQKGDTKFVGTVEQMYASRCFRESRGAGKMGCISCHDPHQRPPDEKKIAYYRTRCLNCHAEESCSLPPAVRREKNEDSCIACHMPRTGSDVNHTSITDHRIPRRPELAAREPVASKWPQAGQVPLILFPGDGAEATDPESARDLGVALLDSAERQPNPTARQLSDLALPMLRAAVTRDARDSPAWEALGSALWLRGQLGEALAAYENALQQAPKRETSLFLAATVALRTKRYHVARRHAERAVQVNPWRWQYHQTLAAIHAQTRDWREAIRECQETLQLHPASLGTRRVLVTAYLRTGDQAKARTEFGVVLSLSPLGQHEALRRWFEELAR